MADLSFDPFNQFYKSPGRPVNVQTGFSPPVMDSRKDFDSLSGDLPGFYEGIGESLGKWKKQEEKKQSQEFGSAASNPLEMLKGFISGQSVLNAGDETGSLQVSPSGYFGLTSPSGFNFSGNPMNQSLGFNVPASVGRTKGTVGLEGSWNSLNPSIQAKFKFGQKPMIPEENVSANMAEFSVSKSIQPWQMAQEQKSQSTAREMADELIQRYRSSGGRDPNRPSSWF